MPERYPYKKLNRYPHMKPGDVAIWERFIDKYPEAYSNCSYDYWVGSPPPFNPIVNDETGGSDDGLYRKKIDVVGYKGDEVDIIEIKPGAELKALDQVKRYVTLFVRDERPTKSPQPVLITDRLRIDMAEFATKEGVKLIIV